MNYLPAVSIRRRVSPCGPELEERLDKLARKTGRTKTYYARAAILEYLDDLEDIHLAEKRYGALAAGRGKTISLDELERTLGLAD